MNQSYQRIIKTTNSDDDPDLKKIIDQEIQAFEDKKVKEVTRKQAESLIKASEAVSSTLGDAATLASSVNVILHTLKIIALTIPVVRVIVTVLSILLNFFKMATGISLTLDDAKEDTATGIYNIAVAVLGIGFGIAAISIVTLAPFMLFVTFASDALLNFWNLGLSITKFFNAAARERKLELKNNKKEFYELIAESKDPTPTFILDLLERKANGKLTVDDFKAMQKYPLARINELDNIITESTNERRKHNSEFCEKAHDCMQNIASHVGGMLMILCPPIGAIVLGVSAIYSILDRFKLNPFRWLGNKIFKNPFAPLTYHASKKEMTVNVNKVAKRKLIEKLTSVPPVGQCLPKLTGRKTTDANVRTVLTSQSAPATKSECCLKYDYVVDAPKVVAEKDLERTQKLKATLGLDSPILKHRVIPRGRNTPMVARKRL